MVQMGIWRVAKLSGKGSQVLRHLRHAHLSIEVAQRKDEQQNAKDPGKPA
jgi:hypothetical protein